MASATKERKGKKVNITYKLDDFHMMGFMSNKVEIKCKEQYCASVFNSFHYLVFRIGLHLGAESFPILSPLNTQPL